MAKKNQHGRISEPYGQSAGAGASRREEFYPPLTTSLKAFVKDGSDREFRQLIFEMNSLFNQMKRHVEHFARFIGVSSAQFSFIMIIAEISNSTVRQIAEQMNVTSPFVTAEIGKLVDMGIVAKKRTAVIAVAVF